MPLDVVVLAAGQGKRMNSALPKVMHLLAGRPLVGHVLDAARKLTPSALVLVVGRDRTTLLGLMLSSQDHHQSDPDWVGIGSGSWDYEGRASWVRLDRVLDVPEEGIRREGAILEREKFEIIAARLRATYSWR